MKEEASPFAILIDYLKQDGLAADAEQLNTLLRESAWTTGSEFLGEFGLRMKELKTAQWHRMNPKTRASFRSAARAIMKVWPDIGL
jgi:hypothetical protein